MPQKKSDLFNSWVHLISEGPDTIYARISIAAPVSADLFSRYGARTTINPNIK